VPPVRLFVPTMDAVLVEAAPDGRLRFENEDWTTPTLQERRAVIHAARKEIDVLQELIDLLDAE
jgi:hypothetical protein